MNGGGSRVFGDNVYIITDRTQVAVDTYLEATATATKDIVHLWLQQWQSQIAVSKLSLYPESITKGTDMIDPMVYNL